MNGKALLVLYSVLALIGTPASAAPLGTGFTYQGRLADGTNAANGTYDFRFAIYDAASGGNQVGPALTNDSVAVANGLFKVDLDFGQGVFDGSARWLASAVRTNGAGAFSLLPPREELSATPYALFAAEAASASTVAGALAEGKIDTGDLRYVHELSDIESLNRRALTGELEVTAVSIHAYAYLARRYALLNSGSSMGDRYGPRLVATTPKPADSRAASRGKRIAVPGKLTTAYLALRLFQPDFVEVVVPFDQIEERVLKGEVDLGLLIHEGQLTYREDGLELWADMGEWWFAETGLPLPLGGNVVRRDLGPAVVAQVARDLKASIVYALEHRGPALEHAKRFNRGIGDEKTDRFVGMYVNQWTVDYGDRGREAVRELLRRGHAAGIIPHQVEIEFVG